MATQKVNVAARPEAVIRDGVRECLFKSGEPSLGGATEIIHLARAFSALSNALLHRIHTQVEVDTVTFVRTRVLIITNPGIDPVSANDLFRLAAVT